MLRANQRLTSTIIQRDPEKLIILKMAGGKTAATLDALYEMFASFEINHALIVAPWFVAKNTWPDEIEAWAHTRCLTYAVAVGEPEEREAAVARRAEITTINFENLTWLAKHIKGVRNWYWDTVVIDESSRLAAGEERTKATKIKTVKKNGEVVVKVREGGNMTRFAIMTTARQKIERVIELTGTPGDIRKLWGQAYLLDRGRTLGRAKSDYEKLYFDRDRFTKAVTEKPGAEDEVLRRLSAANLVVTIQSEGMEPEPRFIPMNVRLPQKAMDEYERFRKNLYSEEWSVEAASSGVLANKLLQAANGSIYQDDRTVVPIHDEKIRALEELVEQANGESIFTWYAFQFDRDALKKRWPDAVVANQYRGDLVGDWNKGRIKHLIAHPACLHPATEVLTERRGWVPLVDVRVSDRVFDGEEFVAHEGCSYSGFKQVRTLFGITMTPDHLMLINDNWVRCDNASDDQGTRAAARYTYSGNAAYLSEMFALRGRAGDCEAELREAQREGARPLSALHQGHVSQSDAHSILSHLAGNEEQGQGRNGRELRRPRNFGMRAMGDVLQFLRRHVARLSGKLNDRADGRGWGLLQRKLHLDHASGAASEQTQQSNARFSGREIAPGRVVPENWLEQIHAKVSVGLGAGSRDRRGGRAGVELRNGSACQESSRGGKAAQMSRVYDLVNCGPRCRFVVRNSDGEAFISHNSIGHGTNLQYGGHIAAWYGLTFNLEWWLQANARLPRTGQTKQVLIYPIIAQGTYDERAMRLLSDKNATQDRIISHFITDELSA